MRLSVVASEPLATMPALTENGRPVTDLSGVNLSRGKSVVLVLDRSQSMAGASLRNATGGRADVRRPEAVGRPDRSGRLRAPRPGADRLLVAPTDADSALSGIRVDSESGTALYDAVVVAAELLGKNAPAGRVIILLTDGHDVSSSATLAEAVAAARAAHAAVYPIAIASHDFDPAPLQQLAHETNGTYHRASSSAALRSVYSSIAAELGRTWQLGYVTAARPGDQVALVATTASGTARAALAIPSGLGAAPAAEPLVAPALADVLHRRVARVRAADRAARARSPASSS